MKVDTIFSPIPSHEINEALGLKPSPVRYFTLFGGILGIVSNVKDSTFTVKVADNVKLEVARGAVMKVIDKDEKITTEEGK